MEERMNIEALVDRVMHGLPKSFAGFRSEIEQHLRPLLQSALDRAGLVTRERFDAQTHVLHQTRAQLDALNKKLDALNIE